MITQTARYTPRNFVPGDGYSAVYSHEVDGRIEIEKVPLEFIAVAEVQFARGTRWVDDGLDIVGVILTDGFFRVTDGDENFHGIVRNGATWDECMGLLPSSMRPLLVKPAC